MNVARVFRSTVIVGVLAAVCSLAGVVGAALSMVACIVALMVLPRPTGEPVRAAPPIVEGFLPWFVCTGWFVAFVLALAPWAELGGVPLGLVLFSPVIGMMVLAIDAGVVAVVRRRGVRNGPAESVTALDPNEPARKTP